MNDLFFVGEQQCPACGHHVNSTLSIRANAPMPKPGRLTMCIHCGTALEFDGELRAQLLTPQRLAAMNPDARRLLARLTEIVRTFWSEQKGTA